MLKLNSINKKFKSIVVADNINVQLENCTYGLLGRNGSGKTTQIPQAHNSTSSFSASSIAERVNVVFVITMTLSQS